MRAGLGIEESPWREVAAASVATETAQRCARSGIGRLGGDGRDARIPRSPPCLRDRPRIATMLRPDAEHPLPAHRRGPPPRHAPDRERPRDDHRVRGGDPSDHAEPLRSRGPAAVRGARIGADAPVRAAVRGRVRGHDRLLPAGRRERGARHVGGGHAVPQGADARDRPRPRALRRHGASGRLGRAAALDLDGPLQDEGPDAALHLVGRPRPLLQGHGRWQRRPDRPIQFRRRRGLPH